MPKKTSIAVRVERVWTKTVVYVAYDAADEDEALAIAKREFGRGWVATIDR